MISFNYKRYLASREWALKREAVRQRSGNRCERCKTNPQDAVHHLTYERVGNERLEDLQAICNACHEFLSGKSNSDPANDFYKKYDDYYADYLPGSTQERPASYINYIRAFCYTCERETTCILRPQDWDLAPNEFTHHPSSREAGDSIDLTHHPVRCDQCGCPEPDPCNQCGNLLVVRV